MSTPLFQRWGTIRNTNFGRKLISRDIRSADIYKKFATIRENRATYTHNTRELGIIII